MSHKQLESNGLGKWEVKAQSPSETALTPKWSELPAPPPEPKPKPKEPAKPTHYFYRLNIPGFGSEIKRGCELTARPPLELHIPIITGGRGGAVKYRRGDPPENNSAVLIFELSDRMSIHDFVEYDFKGFR